MLASAAYQQFERYLEDVANENFPVCELIRAAVLRHQRDLKVQRSEGFPYYFCEKTAAEAIEWFPLKLCHSIGDHAGMPFHLAPWQAFVTGSLFGWKRVSDNSRRFRKALVTVGRKNGKSTWAAGMAIRFANDDPNPKTGQVEKVAKVYLCGPKMAQASMIYDETWRMVQQSPRLRAKAKEAYKVLSFLDNWGTIERIGSDRPFSGLNISLSIVDEMHEMRERIHREFMETLQTSSGSRSQPLFLVTTTAGNDNSTMYNDFYGYVSGVVRGAIDDPTTFGAIYEIDKNDDPLDPEVWIKANPNLITSEGVGSLKPEFLQEAAIEAAASPQSLRKFTRYHCNRVVSASSSAFDMEAWDGCAGELGDWSHADALGIGVDLGGWDDLCGVGMVARFPTAETDSDGVPIPRYEVRSLAFIARGCRRDLTVEPFASLVNEGLLAVVEYPIGSVKDEVVRFCRKYGLDQMTYDPFNAQPMAEDLEQEGLIPVGMNQTYAHFNAPIREFQQALLEKRITHDGSPLLRWCARNAVIVEDAQERAMFTKRDSAGKIDPLVGVLMGFRQCSLSPKRQSGGLFHVRAGNG